MLQGYSFPGDNGKTPLDYLSDANGLRPPFEKPASGWAKSLIDGGIQPWVVIPPVAIWEAGTWYDQLPKKARDYFKLLASEERRAWVVDGRGTPGNYAFRIYILPVAVTHTQYPDHPMDWPDEFKNPPNYASQGYAGGGSSWTLGTPQRQTTPAAPKAPAPPKAPPLPSGIRFRCTDCGHWFKEDMLPKHKMHTCPGKEESRESDWTLLCECCHTLDESAACKPGFPRPKAVKPPKESKEVKETDSTEETPITA